jgi:hypothetical protein
MLALKLPGADIQVAAARWHADETFKGFFFGRNGMIFQNTRLPPY